MLVTEQFILDELELFEAFFTVQEDQIDDFIDNIDQYMHPISVGRVVPISDSETETQTENINSLAGVTDDEWDIRREFTQTMPAYQRQGMLLTLWGFFVNGIERMYVSHFDKRPDKGPKPQSDLGYMLEEFRKDGIPRNPSDEYDSAVNTLDQEVRLIRNAWAHDDGKDTRDKITNNLQYISKVEGRIIIGKCYIKKVISLIRLVSEELNRSI